MWPLALLSACVFVATLGGAILSAALDAWLPAMLLLIVSGLAWMLAAASATYTARQSALWTHMWTITSVTVATLTSLVWFGALYATIWAYNPGALTSSAPLDGWAPYGLAIDAMRSGTGVVLPYSLGARVALAVEQIVVWPTLFLLFASMVAVFSARAGRRPRV